MVPAKPAAGVYVAVPPVTVTVPFAGVDVLPTVSGSPLGSVSFAVRLMVTGLPALNVVVVVALSALATGALLAEGGAADTAKGSHRGESNPSQRNRKSLYRSAHHDAPVTLPEPVYRPINPFPQSTAVGSRGNSTKVQCRVADREYIDPRHACVARLPLGE